MFQHHHLQFSSRRSMALKTEDGIKPADYFDEYKKIFYIAADKIR